jgi:hypothetical protein
MRNSLDVGSLDSNPIGSLGSQMGLGGFAGDGTGVSVVSDSHDSN